MGKLEVVGAELLMDGGRGMTGTGQNGFLSITVGEMSVHKYKYFHSRFECNNKTFIFYLTNIFYMKCHFVVPVTTY